MDTAAIVANSMRSTGGKVSGCKVPRQEACGDGRRMTLLSEILVASRPALVAQWKVAFDRDPPPRVDTSLLRRVLAWHAQMEVAGIKDSPPRVMVYRSNRQPQLVPGTRLLREWHGNTYEVLVLAYGFEHAGRTYTSLTAIARMITGTSWSGPLFFGVKR